MGKLVDQGVNQRIHSDSFNLRFFQRKAPVFSSCLPQKNTYFVINVYLRIHTYHIYYELAWFIHFVPGPLRPQEFCFVWEVWRWREPSRSIITKNFSSLFDQRRRAKLRILDHGNTMWGGEVMRIGAKTNPTQPLSQGPQRPLEPLLRALFLTHNPSLNKKANTEPP